MAQRAAGEHGRNSGLARRPQGKPGARLSSGDSLGGEAVIAAPHFLTVPGKTLGSFPVPVAPPPRCGSSGAEGSGPQ